MIARMTHANKIVRETPDAATRENHPKIGKVLVELDAVMQEFAQTYPRKSEVVALKVFGGNRQILDAAMTEATEQTMTRSSA